MVDAQLHRAIENLVHEWARTIDEDRLEELAALLGDPGEYKVVSRFNLERELPLAVIHCKSRAQLRDRITSLQVANIYEKHYYRHIISGVQVNRPGRRRVRSALELHGEPHYGARREHDHLFHRAVQGPGRVRGRRAEVSSAHRRFRFARDRNAAGGASLDPAALCGARDSGRRDEGHEKAGIERRVALPENRVRLAFAA